MIVLLFISLLNDIILLLSSLTYLIFNISVTLSANSECNIVYHPSVLDIQFNIPCWAYDVSSGTCTKQENYISITNNFHTQNECKQTCKSQRSRWIKCKCTYMPTYSVSSANIHGNQHKSDVCIMAVYTKNSVY